MGEISEMMLDGTLCEGCGVAMIDGPDDEVAGHPVRCASCVRELRQANLQQEGARGGTRPSNPHGDRMVLVPAHVKVNCPDCNAKVKAIGLGDHMRHKHGVAK